MESSSEHAEGLRARALTDSNSDDFIVIVNNHFTDESFSTKPSTIKKNGVGGHDEHVLPTLNPTIYLDSTSLSSKHNSDDSPLGDAPDLDGWIKSGSRSNYSDDSAISSTPSLELSAYKRLQQWIYCIAIVNFDIEIGQSIECIFPKDAKLTDRETSNICYLSFPDSNSCCMGDSQFYFRTRACPIERPSFEQFYKGFNEKCLQTLEVDKSYFYGYVYFRQVKDREARRGYFQKSLVILSWFPFVSLFNQILKFLAPEYFIHGMTTLEAACGEINRWPSPITGQILSLPMFGTVNQVLIPDDKYSVSTQSQLVTERIKAHSSSTLSLKSLSLSFKPKKGKVQESTDLPHTDSSPNLSCQLVINVSNDINTYRVLLPVVSHIQLLWELVLTNEPLTVITSTPTYGSEVVCALVNSISPLRYGADYRPFFTIHDSEFKEYTSHTRSPPPVILGVTNPFFVKTLKDWPHIVKINEFASDHKKCMNVNAASKKNANKSLDLKTGVYTKYKPFLQKDREILKMLLKGIESSRPSEAQNALLRRFFIELTQSFLIPLERYFASLMPLARNVSPFKRPPMLDFKVEEFLSTLEATGPHLTSGIKGDWTGLYRRFLRSPNFVAWYHKKLSEANTKIMSLHLETICDANLVDLVTNKAEVEIVDLILKMKESLQSSASGRLQIPTEMVVKLKSNMNKVISKLPEDSRSLFMSNHFDSS